MVVPRYLAGWLIVEHPIKIDDLGIQYTPISGNLHISLKVLRGLSSFASLASRAVRKVVMISKECHSKHLQTLHDHKLLREDLWACSKIGYTMIHPKSIQI